MHSRIIAVGLVSALLSACGDESSESALRISPSEGGAAEVHGPTKFTAEVVNSADTVTWTVTGGGSLSGTSGYNVVYTPPLGSGSASLTATAGSLTAEVQITSSPASLTIPQITAQVTVQYDAQDIPHIKCAAINDCLAAQGYIHARDRLFPMDFTRRVARSRLAELIGVDGLSQDIQLRTVFTMRNGHRLEDDLVAALTPADRARMDAYARGINAYLAELRATPGAALPGEYAQLPFRITAADIPDWTPEDSIAVGRLQAFQLSETIESEAANGAFAQVYGTGARKDDGKMRAWLRAAAPPTERAHTLSPGPVIAAASAPALAPTVDMARWSDAINAVAARAGALNSALRPVGAEVGSNNWVIRGNKSATGKAMVANDPHLPLQYPPLFHLSVMTSTNPADNFDLAGGVFPGIPGALVGRGAHVGWGVTVVGYDVTDLYLEQVVLPASPGCSGPAPCVVFKGVPTRMLPVPQTYRVRVAAGAAGLVDAKTLGLPAATAPPAAVLIVPHHGPIIQAPDAAGKAVSMRWTGHEGNTQDSAAIFGLNTAVDVDAAMVALKGFSTGAQNFVLADDQGNIGYDPHALVPVRRFADIGNLPAGLTAPRPPWLPLASDGLSEWGDGVHDCAAAAVDPACWIADEDLPQGKNPDKGYFVTANADPIGVSDDDGPLGPLASPPYFSFGWSDSSGFRATRITQMIDTAIADKGTVSLADMEAIQADHVSRPGMAFDAYISRIPASAGPPELQAAQAVLAKWAANGWGCPTGLTGSDPVASPPVTDAKVLESSAGCFLFHLFVRRVARNVFIDDLAPTGQGVNGLSALKALLFMLEPGPTVEEDPAATTFCDNVTATGIAQRTCRDQVVIALVDAYSTLRSQVGANPNTWLWGRVHTIQPISLLAPLVSTNYAPGPYARPGGAFTVDVGSPSLLSAGLSFSYSSGGNVRHISVMDPAKPVVRMQLPGPQRDRGTGFPGPDLLGQWVNNVYFDFAYGAQIDGVTVSTEVFKP